MSNALLGEAKNSGMSSLISKPIGKTQLTSFLAEYTGTLLVSPIYKDSQGSPEVEVFNKQEALSVCGDDKNFLKTLLTDMAKDLKANKQNLEICVQRKDCARAAEVAHNVKGMAAVCSFKRLAAAASNCQKSASISDYMEVRRLSQIVFEELSMAIKLAENFDASEN